MGLRTCTKLCWNYLFCKTDDDLERHRKFCSEDESCFMRFPKDVYFEYNNYHCKTPFHFFGSVPFEACNIKNGSVEGKRMRFL